MPRDKEREISSDREDMETASQSADRILERINSMEGNLRKDLRDVTKRVDLLERWDKSRPPPLKETGDRVAYRLGRQEARGLRESSHAILASFGRGGGRRGGSWYHTNDHDQVVRG